MSKKYLVIYASETGNTKKLATEIYDTIDDGSKTITHIRAWNGKTDADIWFVGFFANRSSCSVEVMDLLTSLHNKQVVLFGTCGLDDSPEYFKRLERNALAFLSDDNTFHGSFFCPGRIHPEVKSRCEALCAAAPDGDEVRSRLLGHFERNIDRPDENDILNLRDFAESVLDKLKKGR